MKLDPKALGKAHSIMEEQLGFVVHSPIARDVVLTYLSNLQPSKEVRELVERLRENIIADAFERYEIVSGRLAERLIRERLDAADLLSRMDGEGWRPKVKPLDDPAKEDKFAYWNSLPESEKAKIRQEFHDDMYGGADD